MSVRFVDRSLPHEADMIPRSAVDSVIGEAQLVYCRDEAPYVSSIDCDGFRSLEALYYGRWTFSRSDELSVSTV